MSNLQRIYQLHRILASRTLPVSHQTLEEHLECSRATVNRTIESLRLYFNAPILYDRERNGYYYDTQEKTVFELPGVWFDAQELHALLTMQQLLEQIQPGLLALQLKPMQEHLKKILATQQLNDPDAVKRIRILTMLSRQLALQHFQSAASAVLQRKQLEIIYHGRGRDRQTERIVSPQRLTHYRDNWYLDAWCHKREALRSFAVERIAACQMLDHTARNINDNELNSHFASSYGNRFDQRAVRIDWQGEKLGYIPAKDNAAVSQLLDRGETMSALIVGLKKSNNPWERIEVEVRWRV